MPNEVPTLPETFKNFISLLNKSLLPTNNDGKAFFDDEEEDNEFEFKFEIEIDDDIGDEVVADEIVDADAVAVEISLLRPPPPPILSLLPRLLLDSWFRGEVKLLAAAGVFLPFTTDEGGAVGGPTVLALKELNFSNKAEPLRLGNKKLGTAVVGWGAPVWLGSVAAVVQSLLMLKMKVMNIKFDDVKLKLINCWILLW